MSENPFAAALGKPEVAPTYQLPHKPFFGVDQDAQTRARREGMTRQELFEDGALSVADLDDEELRVGRCRGIDGRIVTGGQRTKMMPRDIYDAMVQEHMSRTNEKIRTQVDAALGVLVDIMTDDTNEPKDRADAAKYLFERHAGKTPERVQVAVAKAPWEELIGGIARMSRAESEALRGKAIERGNRGAEIMDAEVVEHEAEVWDPRSGPGRMPSAGEGVQGAGARDDELRDGKPDAPQRKFASRATDYTATTDDARLQEGYQEQVHAAEPDYRSPVEQLGIHDLHLMGDQRIVPPMPIPTHYHPQANDAPDVVLAKTNAELLREQQDAAKELSERRAAAKAKIQNAKKRRIIAKTMGRDAVQPNTISLTENNGRLQFKIGGTQSPTVD